MTLEDIRNLEELLRAVRKGQRPTYLFFWGHRPLPNGEIGTSCFSQWWPAPFLVREVSYATAEHFMMAEKARLFGIKIQERRFSKPEVLRLQNSLVGRSRILKKRHGKSHGFSWLLKATTRNSVRILGLEDSCSAPAPRCSWKQVRLIEFGGLGWPRMMSEQ